MLILFGFLQCSHYRWNVCYESRLHLGWNSYYMPENQCNQDDTQGWKVNLMFNAIASQALLYGMEERAGTISLIAWNDREKIQKNS